MPRKKRKPIPPCPDPNNYTLVELEDRYIWKRKRGTVKPARLNASFQKNAGLTALTNAAARRIFGRLLPYLEGLSTGRAQARVGGRLKKAINARGRMDFGFLEGFDFQEKHPLTNLVKGNFSVQQDQRTIAISLKALEQSLKRHSGLVSDYYFEGILLHGDPARDRGLKVESVQSKLYRFGEAGSCRLELYLPARKVPWMLLLKASCLEGPELALHPKHYGMRVVRVGV